MTNHTKTQIHIVCLQSLLHPSNTMAKTTLRRSFTILISCYCIYLLHIIHISHNKYNTCIEMLYTHMYPHCSILGLDMVKFVWHWDPRSASCELAPAGACDMSTCNESVDPKDPSHVLTIRANWARWQVV